MADIDPNANPWPTIMRNVGGWPVRSRAVELTGRVVTHQQLTNTAFYNLVRGPLLMGDVTVIDQRVDRVVVNGEALTFEDPRAASALAASQERWAGVNPEQAPIYDTLGVDWMTREIQDATQGKLSAQQVAQQARNATGDVTGVV